ncbi:MAG: hypothetical protein K2X03_23220 [Bryobacteraceae bacterium]|nr:hypothetical protein [Bryobacteraceae bacterium]
MNSVAMKNRTTFAALLLETFKEYLDFHKYPDRLASASALMLNDLYGTSLAVPKIASLRRDEIHFMDIFRGFMEVTISFETLKHIDTYLSTFPKPAPRGVTPNAYVRYHFENYLHETYILKERLMSIVTKLERSYRKDPAAQEFKERCRELRNMVEKTMAGISMTRGSHVHEMRFSDADLRALSMVDLLSRSKKFPIKKEYRSLYQQVVEAKLEVMRQNEQQLEILLDTYFGTIQVLVYTESSSFIFPTPPRRLRDH